MRSFSTIRSFDTDHLGPSNGERETNATPAARQIADAVPPLADHLIELRPGHVYREAVKLFERALLAHALAVTGGNQLRAARLLGLNRNTLRERCRELELLPRRPVRASSATEV